MAFLSIYLIRGSFDKIFAAFTASLSVSNLNRDALLIDLILFPLRLYII